MKYTRAMLVGKEIVGVNWRDPSELQEFLEWFATADRQIGLTAIYKDGPKEIKKRPQTEEELESQLHHPDHLVWDYPKGAFAVVSTLFLAFWHPDGFWFETMVAMDEDGMKWKDKKQYETYDDALLGHYKIVHMLSLDASHAQL